MLSESYTMRESMTCEKCGKKTPVTLWACVDGLVNTRTKKKLMNGDLFKFKCKHCGEVQYIPYPTMYIDDNEEMIIFFANSDESENVAYEAIDNRLSLLSDEKNDSYKIRVVSHPDEIQEKIRTFEMRMDDRIIEVAKFSLLRHITQSKEVDDVQFVRCWIEDNKNMTFYVFGKQEKQYCVQYDFYTYLERKCNPFLNNHKNEYVVDLDWAIDFLDTHDLVAE